MNIKQIEKRIITLVQQEGRRPRILLAPLKSAHSDSWTKPLAATFAEFGFDVDIGPASQAPVQAARLAIDNDVHIICVYVSNIDHLALVVQLAETLKAEGGADIRLVAGGAGLQQNDEELYGAGVDLIINLNKADIHLIDQILDLLDESGPGLKP
jgi:methylmalonyl-CoA mutase